MKRLEKTEKKEKQVRIWEKKLELLYQIQYNQPYIELEKPIRNGWFKHLILREDVSRRKDANVFQEILNRCGNQVWGSDKKQVDKNWSSFHHRAESTQFPGLMLLQGEKLVGISKKSRSWFDGYDWKWSNSHGYVKRYYCKVPRYYFIIAYTKAYITKMKVIDPEISSQIAELENMLKQNEYYDVRSDISRRNSKNRPFNHSGRKRKRVRDQLKHYDERSFEYWSNKPVSIY